MSYLLFFATALAGPLCTIVEDDQPGVVERCEVFEAALPIPLSPLGPGWVGPEPRCPAGKTCRAGEFDDAAVALAAQAGALAAAAEAEPPSMVDVLQELNAATAGQGCNHQFVFAIGTLPETFATPRAEIITQASHCLGSQGHWLRFNTGPRSRLNNPDAAWFVYLAALRTGSSPVDARLFPTGGASREVTIVSMDAWFQDDPTRATFDECVADLVAGAGTAACQALPAGSVKLPVRVRYVQDGNLGEWVAGSPGSPFHLDDADSIIDPFRMVKIRDGAPGAGRLTKEALGRLYWGGVRLIRRGLLSP